MEPSRDPVLRLSHIGICVSDLERSAAFYREALGFRECARLSISGPESEKLLALDDVALNAVYLERDGTRIELIHFETPGEVGAPGPHPVNRLGLTHLSFRVAALDACLEAVTRQGGSVLSTSRTESPRFRTTAVFVTDPDGLRIELMERPGDPNALPGQPA